MLCKEKESTNSWDCRSTQLQHVECLHEGHASPAAWPSCLMLRRSTRRHAQLILRRFSADALELSADRQLQQDAPFQHALKWHPALAVDKAAAGGGRGLFAHSPLRQGQVSLSWSAAVHSGVDDHTRCARVQVVLAEEALLCSPSKGNLSKVSSTFLKLDRPHANLLLTQL